MRKKLLKFYSKHLIKIEITLISIFMFLLLIFNLEPPMHTGDIIFWVTIGAIIFPLHQMITVEIWKKESNPLASLRIDRYRTYSIRIIGVSFVVSMFFGVGFLVSLFLLGLTSIYPLVSSSRDLILLFSGYYLILIIVPLATIFVLFTIPSLPSFRKARFCFVTVLEFIEKRKKEERIKEKNKKTEIISRWFVVGLKAYNTFLYENKPTHVNIVGINQINSSFCTAILTGEEEEISIITDNLKQILDSMHGKQDGQKLRAVLTALKNIETGNERKVYSIAELSKMIHSISFFEKIKEGIKSPYFATFLAGAALMIEIFVR